MTGHAVAKVPPYLREKQEEKKIELLYFEWRRRIGEEKPKSFPAQKVCSSGRQAVEKGKTVQSKQSNKQ